MVRYRTATNRADHLNYRLAGADIKELKDLTFGRAYRDNYLQNLNNGVTSIKKPILGVVNGYAVRDSERIALTELNKRYSSGAAWSSR